MSGSVPDAVWNIAPTIVGQVLGSVYQNYLPTDPMAPIGSGSLVGPLNCWITADKKGMATQAFDPAKPPAYSLHDPTKTSVGSYLVGPLGTFFIGSQDVPQPIEVIRCNTVLTISRPGGPVPGPAYYGGDTTATETPLLAGWPAAVIQGLRGEKGEVNLPGDVRVPWQTILMPTTLGVTIRNGDQAFDNSPIPNRYTLASVELTTRGYRMTAMLETP